MYILCDVYIICVHIYICIRLYIRMRDGMLSKLNALYFLHWGIYCIWTETQK